MRVLASEELSVGEAAAVVQTPQSSVSRHLKMLHDAGLVARRSEGPASFYRLTLDDLAQPARGLWMSVREAVDAYAESAADSARLRDVLRERRSDSQAFFGRVAGEWDDLRARLFGDAFTASALLGLLAENWTVIDVGCGTGNVAELLAPHVKRVIGVDASPTMLEAARKRLAGARNVKLMEGDACSLPAGDASADAAIFCLLLHHVERADLALVEAARVLAPGGVALVIDMDRHARDDYRRTMGHVHMGFDRASVERWGKAAGFARVRVRPITLPGAAQGPPLFAARMEMPAEE